MNRLRREIVKRLYTMDLEFDNLVELTEQERKDWKDMWIFNDIACAIRRQNMEE